MKDDTTESAGERRGTAALRVVREATTTPLDAAAVARVLRSRAMALGADRHEAEDLAQETLARVMERAPDKAGHIGYATRTLTRIWLDRQRSLRARAKRLRLMAVSTLAGPATFLGADEGRRAIVLNAIQTLPPKQRAALVLRLVEGLGYGAIAEAIGCSEVAARASLHEARSRLRRELTQRGIEP